jgi:hypothetical protein
MSDLMKSTRTTGRTNSEVLAELVKEAAPGTVFSYEELRDVLEADTETRFDRPRVCAAVRRANTRILRQHQRELRVVKGSGYRLASASEHLELALGRTTRADRQIRRGLLTLNNVRWNELDPNARAAHEGQLLLTSAMYQMVSGLRRRQDRSEQVIRDVLRRVERLENPGGDPLAG